MSEREPKLWPALLVTLCLAVGWRPTDAGAQTDLGPLFAPPTPAEIAAVQADWAGRPQEAGGFVLERTAGVDGFAVSRASFQYEGLTQYGLVRYPRDFTAGGSFPVLVLHHGGDQGLYYLDGIHFDATYPVGCLADSAFVLMPTYRGEAFAGGDVLGNRFSQGEPSLWDHDCDDAMAMLTAFLAATPEADPQRLLSMGRSRGGAVAYHMALRDTRLRRSVVFFGSSDMRQPVIEADCQAEVDQGVTATNTLSRKVMDHIVLPWLAGDLGLTEARARLIGWSIAYHLEAPLDLQIHHGEMDENIPIIHAELVDAALTAAGAEAPEYSFHRYPLAGHSTAGMTGYEVTVEDYICGLGGGPVAPVPVPGLEATLSAWPNPFTGEVRLRWEGGAKSAAEAPAAVRIVDLRGRLLRTLRSEGTDGFFRWDGRDAAGREAPAGVYLVEAGDEKNPDLKAGVPLSGARGRLLKLR